MFVYSVFRQLNNIISSEFSTLFDSYNLALSHSFDIFVSSITFVNRIYYMFPWFNIELVNLRKLLRRQQHKYASSKLESDLISFNVFDRFTKKNFSLPNQYTSLMCSVVMEYLLRKLINYISPYKVKPR